MPPVVVVVEIHDVSPHLHTCIPTGLISSVPWHSISSHAATHTSKNPRSRHMYLHPETISMLVLGQTEPLGDDAISDKVRLACGACTESMPLCLTSFKDARQPDSRRLEVAPIIVKPRHKWFTKCILRCRRGNADTQSTCQTKSSRLAGWAGALGFTSTQFPPRQNHSS
uniref:Uncharacterized protein n=1 Tax=Mesocestoides corti TaxID=53468 RepID=A0A5K3G1D9_MESCO